MGCGIRPVPAIPDAVIVHLTLRFNEDGVGVASWQMARAVMGAVHEMAHEPNPAMHNRIKQAMKGFRRRQAVERGKTTKSGEAAVVAITETAMDDLDPWREVQGGGDRPFPLTGDTVRHRIVKAAKDAGLGDGFSGHSPRVRMAVRMVERSAPENAVMQQGRWRTSAVVGRYTKKLKAGEASRYL